MGTADGDETYEEDWLTCLWCDHVFQGRDLRDDGIGGRQGCPNCPGSGIGFRIRPAPARSRPLTGDAT